MSDPIQPSFNSENLQHAISESRLLVESALDVLVEVIHEVSGVLPDRERVRFVGLFWLLHVCDQVVYEQKYGGIAPSVSPSSSAFNIQSARSRLLSRIGSPHSAVSVYAPYLKVSASHELVAATKARRLMRWQSVPIPMLVARVPDTVKRKAIAASTLPDSVVNRALSARVALGAPVELVESYHDFASWADTAANSSLRLLYTANAHQSSVAFRHLAFAQRRLGTHLAIHQHGGGYGVDPQHLGEEHDVALADSFFSWGWQLHPSVQNVRPLPTAMPRRRHESRTDEILVMSLPVTTHFYRLQAFVEPSQVAKCVDETIVFMSELADTMQVRLRSSGADSFPVNRLHASSAGITIDDGRQSGVAAASRAGLVIHNYLGTSWLETLAMNVPTVCFIPPDIHRFRSAAQPFADAFMRVGILHYSGVEAARFVNSLKGDPSSWWNSSEVQEARQAFVARYANFSENWLEAWMNEFERILAE